MLRSNASYVITPDSFQISPAITGLPLARPSRRLVAMLLDLFFVVLLLFLRSFRSAVITFATIVFSVLITINLIYFGGFTLNVLTLMGLAMGFGLIVDNAIVVLDLRSTVGASQWYDELHPSTDGFKQVRKRFRKRILELHPLTG